MILRYFFEKIILILDNYSQKKNFLFIIKVLGNKIEYFFDVGFHKGETIDLARKFFSIKKIHAFEPNPDSYKMFKKNFSDDVTLINKGVGKKNGKRDFYLNDFSPINSFNNLNYESEHTKIKGKILKHLYSSKINNIKKEIEVITLEKYCNQKSINTIDILKIDTEGCEYDVLRGLGQKITNVKCILFEHHYDKSLIKNYKFGDINKLLKDNGFKKIFKNKMIFRNIFEYVYVNKKLIN